MIYAITDGGIRIEASPDQKAFCELCREPVLSKCGEIRIHHWSHRSGTECNLWHEPETPWHTNWKKQFAESSREFVMIRENGGKHRADINSIRWSSGYTHVIEFQHSPLEIGQLRERENFYGSMTWVIDASEFKRNIIVNEVYDRGDMHVVYFDWKWYRKAWSGANRQLYFDTGDGLWEVRRLDDAGSGAARVISYHDFLSEYSDATGENLEIHWSKTKTNNLIYRYGFGFVLIFKREDGGYGINVLRDQLDTHINRRGGVYPTVEDAKRRCEPHIGFLMRQGRTRAEANLMKMIAETRESE